MPLCAAVVFSPLESALARGRGVEDSFNSVAAASLTGILYKSTGTHIHIHNTCTCINQLLFPQVSTCIHVPVPVEQWREEDGRDMYQYQWNSGGVKMELSLVLHEPLHPNWLLPTHLQPTSSPLVIWKPYKKTFSKCHSALSVKPRAQCSIFQPPTLKLYTINCGY